MNWPARVEGRWALGASVPTVFLSTGPDASGVQRVSLNPYHPITPYICRVCWNVLDDKTSYCRRCGHAGTCFLKGEVFGEKCFQHPRQPAAQFCNYCCRPFCDRCLQTNPDSSLSLGTWTYHCFLCLADIAFLKQQRLSHDVSYCWRHPDVRAQEKCIGCQGGICEFCTYYPVRGLFRKRIDPVPLCFSCVRGKIGYRARRCVVKRFVEKPAWSDYVF